MIRNKKTKQRHGNKERFIVRYYLPLWMKERVDDFLKQVRSGAMPRGMGKTNLFNECLEIHLGLKIISGVEVIPEKLDTDGGENVWRK